MIFADLHIHALYGVDDGAQTQEEMLQIIEAAYSDGTRYICFTPHYHPGYFGDNSENVQARFEEIRRISKERYPNLTIILGNELRYNNGCETWIRNGLCRTINYSRYVLVDFSQNEKSDVISTGLNKILNSGYIPILAHAERYSKLDMRMHLIREYKSNGVLIQIDSQSLLGGFGYNIARKAKKILKNNLADFVSSDAHDIEHRPPELSGCYSYVMKKYGKPYADMLFLENAKRLIFTSD